MANVALVPGAGAAPPVATRRKLQKPDNREIRGSGRARTVERPSSVRCRAERAVREDAPLSRIGTQSGNRSPDGGCPRLVCTNAQMLRGKLVRSLRHDAPKCDLCGTFVADRLVPRSQAENRIVGGTHHRPWPARYADHRPSAGAAARTGPTARRPLPPCCGLGARAAASITRAWDSSPRPSQPR